MGCCLSRIHTPPNSPPIAALPPPEPQPHVVALGERYNHTLQPPAPWTSADPITRDELRRAREEFWETRVQGREEIWSALRMAVELLPTERGTAQEVLTASGVTTPTGNLVEGAFDEHGSSYRIPTYVLSDPTNVVGGTSSTSDTQSDTQSDDEDGYHEDDGSEREDDSSERGMVLKRDGPVAAPPPGEQFTIRARLSDGGGRDLVVQVGVKENVSAIAKRIEGLAKLSGTDKRVTLVYLGKILPGNTTLLDAGWKKGDTINALVGARESLMGKRPGYLRTLS